MVAVMGKSGSGKSTLLNILGGMMSFDDGEYIYKGKKVNSRKQGELTKFRRHEICFVMQYFAPAAAGGDCAGDCKTSECNFGG